MKLKEELESIVSKIVDEFCKKNDLTFEFWVADDITGTACFDYDQFYNLSDICFDLFTNQPNFRISEWLQKSLDNNNFEVNYQSYCMGKIIDFKTKTPF